MPASRRRSCSPRRRPRWPSPASPAAVEPPLAFFVPGRIEVLGKHTDYAGGRTMVAAVERGFCMVALPRDDRQIVVIDAASGETVVFHADPELKPPTGSWSNYPMTVARRVARNFPGALRGADLALASDLPPAAGMSSSSALMVGVFLVLAEVNQLAARDEYWHNIGNKTDLAGYLGTIENGQSFGTLEGDRGVGTFGGSEDHTAILCAEPNHISQYAYCPVEFEKLLPVPPGHVFAIGISGVVAEKTGAALEKYNRASRLTSALVELWRRETGRDDPHLAAALGSSPDAAERLRVAGGNRRSGRVRPRRAWPPGSNISCSKAARSSPRRAMPWPAAICGRSAGWSIARNRPPSSCWAIRCRRRCSWPRPRDGLGRRPPRRLGPALAAAFGHWSKRPGPTSSSPPGRPSTAPSSRSMSRWPDFSSPAPAPPRFGCAEAAYVGAAVVLPPLEVGRNAGVAVQLPPQQGFVARRSRELPSSKQLVGEVLAGRTSPRAVAGPLAVHYCAGLAGVSLRDYTLNPRCLADCIIRYYERFRPDAVWMSADTWVTAQAMGASVGFPNQQQPMAGVGGPCIRSAADIDRIPPPDPSSQGRWPIMLEAMRYVVDAIGDRVFIVACFDQYPFSLACAMMGIQQVMLKLLDDRPLVEAMMERAAEYTIAYASALADAGADMLSGGDSPAGLIGPELYRQAALPFERRVIGELKRRCLVPVSLHICGNAVPILPEMAGSGADVLELDHQVDAAGGVSLGWPGRRHLGQSRSRGRLGPRHAGGSPPCDGVAAFGRHCVRPQAIRHQLRLHAGHGNPAGEYRSHVGYGPQPARRQVILSVLIHS